MNYSKSAWLKVFVDHPFKTILLMIGLLVLASIGAKNLAFNGDYKVYFEKNNPQRLAFEEMQTIFNKNETANILITNNQGNIFNSETLGLIADLTEQAWQTPLSIRVDSLTNFQHTRSEEDDLIVEELVYDAANLNQTDIARIKEIATSEPNVVNKLVSETGEVALVSITVNLPDGDKSKANQLITDSILSMTTSFEQQYPNHDFYHSGLVFMNKAFEDEAKRDAETLVPLMFLVIIVMLWLLLRSFFATLATLLIVVMSISSTMGIAGWLGLAITTATVNVPTLVMTLAVADCVHVVVSMFYEMRQGATKTQAIRKSIELNFKPILITSVTTAIGFLTLNFSNVPALAELGSLTALGVMIAFLLSVTLLPALLHIMPLKTPSQRNTKESYIAQFGEWVIKRHRVILPFSLVIAILAVGTSFLNETNDVPINYFDDTNSFKQAADFQSEKLSGMTTIDFALDTGQESGVNDPQNLTKIHEFSQWLLEQNEVDHVASLTDTYLRLNKNMHGDDPSYYRLPDNQNLAAQFLLLYEMSLPFNLDVNNMLNVQKSAMRITVTMQNLGSKELTEFESRAYNWIEEYAPELILTTGSQNLMFAHIGEANMQSMLKGTVFALILISLILVFALKSLRMGLISLIPNLLPAGIGFGIWGIYSGEINMGLSVVLSMALGIIVDDTVHFLSKYKRATDSGSSPVESIRYAFRSVGSALVVTTVVLTCGFAMLTLSSFALNSDMGLLVGIIIVVALIIDLVFLPAFLLFFDKKRATKEVENV